MKKRILLIVPLLLACGSGGHTLNGTLDLIGSSSDAIQSGSTCYGSGGYSDLHQGAAVVVKDETGKLIGTGSLAGRPGSDPQVRCTFSFSVPNLPDANFYKVEVSHRGELDYSRSDLDKAGWKISAVIGG